MSVRREIEPTIGLYFVTVTCCNWLPLFSAIKSYDLVYKWFDVIRKNNHLIHAYVIMPNHLHVIFFLTDEKQSVNKIVSNGKRFMAYEMVNRLTKMNHPYLQQLKNAVTASEKKQGTLHKVFEPSFDVKRLYTDKMTEQKVNYIHQNPVKTESMKCNDATKYKHCSAGFYSTEQQGIYEVTHWRMLQAFLEDRVQVKEHQQIC